MDTTPELELQQELERFATQFSDRITQATATLERSGREGVRDEALRKNLLYVSSAVEIATGPAPGINLLDMVVFIRLSRTLLERHWIPTLYGEQGADLAEVFARAERDLSAITDRVLSVTQREQVVALVDSWLADNPGQVRVEGVRLADFSAAAGSKAAERSIRAQGLLSGLKVAAQTANQAMLLSERGLFLVHRLPFLWRLQARLAGREMMSDALTRLIEGPQAPLARLSREARRFAWAGLIAIVLVAVIGLLVCPGFAGRR